MTAVGFEPTQLSLVELESTPLDHSGKLSLHRFLSGVMCGSACARQRTMVKYPRPAAPCLGSLALCCPGGGHYVHRQQPGSPIGMPWGTQGRHAFHTWCHAPITTGRPGSHCFAQRELSDLGQSSAAERRGSPMSPDVSTRGASTARTEKGKSANEIRIQPLAAPQLGRSPHKNYKNDLDDQT